MNKNSIYQENLLEGDYFPKVVAYYFKEWNEFRMPPHRHDQVEIMYVIHGKCMVDVEGERILLKKNDFILLDANIAHALTVEKHHPCRMLNIEFRFMKKEGPSPSFKVLAAQDKAFSQMLNNCWPYLVLKDQEDTYHILKSLVQELNKKNSQNEIMTHLLISQLLIQIARMAEDSIVNPPRQQTNQYVQQTIAFIRENYDRDLEIKELADRVNLHPGYLHRIFKRFTGATVIEYVTSLRMEKAKMLLAETEIPVIDICDYIGMNSRQYFSALFKKYTGQAPVEFRKARLREQEICSW
ncbi:AraC family transcriptional regulator [Fictibacillus fluitans]|uniref:AraC family transcriptional regulator n=1 Tax=Fictibacillus fluitans TaxID=3058422 RepID=A0ABT8I1F9_9BACL|nr:AraC family transcriptional regulator [Fictibacillus sp. NE201]MDN4526857.1 AraC family transcriptional regulator [Fictibacillus sp. NE201]